MQYVDKDGNIHDLPLASVQPIVSPDSDNALYEAANGLKVDKSSAGNSLRTRFVQVVIATPKLISQGTSAPVYVKKSDIWDALNLKPGEHIWGGQGTDEDVFNFTRAELYQSMLSLGAIFNSGDNLLLQVANPFPATLELKQTYFSYFIYWFE